jgi:hypothetical protein
MSQIGFAVGTVVFQDRRWISSRISPVILGRPPRERERHRQKSRKPARCQPTTVSGLTITRTSAQRDQNWRNIVQNIRSRVFTSARGRFRLSTATCWRSARISTAVSHRLERKTLPFY